MKLQYTLLVFLSFLLLSCNPEEPEPDNLPVSRLTFRVVEYNTNVVFYPVEVIISDMNGKKLFDTVATTYHELNVKVKSQDTSFIVTTISQYFNNDHFYINSFVQVNPNNWDIQANTNFNHFKRVEPPRSQRAKLTYTNFPVVPENKHWFSDSYEPTIAQNTNLNTSNRELKVDYNKNEGRNFTYLVIPELNLYKMAEVTETDAIINLNTMEPAFRKQVNITPANLSPYLYFLAGYPNQNDLSNAVLLYYSGDVAFKGNFDLVYPKKDIYQYELSGGFNDKSDVTYSSHYYSLADSVPTNISLMDKSYLKIQQQTFNQLQIEFTKEKPTYYKVNIGSSSTKFYWNIFLPANQTTFKPQKYYNSLNSKLLQGKTFPAMQPKWLFVEKADNFTYQQFLDYMFLASHKSSDKKIRLSRTLMKYLQ